MRSFSILWRLFSRAQRALFSKYFLYNLFLILSKFYQIQFFEVFSFKEIQKQFVELFLSNSHQDLLPRITSENLFQIWIPSLFMGSSLEKMWRLFQCWFKLTSNCQSKYYFLQSFPDFNSISFHGFHSGEKSEGCKFVGDFFSRAQRALLQNEVFTICKSKFYQIQFFEVFSLKKKSKTVCFPVLSHLHQDLLQKFTS